jgi:hypothetical protein
MRTTNAVPPDLEALVLQCLRKNPENRPPDARALRQALEHCTMTPAWTHDDATAWWRAFRTSEQVPVSRPPDDRMRGLTITVDVDDRVASR